MSDTFVAALDAEIAALEADIAARPDVRVVKLSNLRSLRQKFYTGPDLGASVANGTLTITDQFGSQSVRTHVRSTGRRRAPETEAALNAASELIAGRSEPTRTSEIFDYLRSRGIQVPGTDPASNLSAMLSKARNFISHGRAGWTLASASDDGPPDPNQAQHPRSDPPEQLHYDISQPPPPPTSPTPTATQPGAPWAQQRKDDIFE